MNMRIINLNDGQRSSIKGMQNCLKQLHEEAENLDLFIAATLIGAAIEAIGDEMLEKGKNPPILRLISND